MNRSWYTLSMEREKSIAGGGVKIAALMIGAYGLVGALNDPRWFLAIFAALALGLLRGSSLARTIALAGTGSLGLFSAVIFLKGAFNPQHQAPTWFLTYFAAAAAYWLFAAMLLAKSVRVQRQLDQYVRSE